MAEWKLKTVGSLVFIALFFTGYLLLLKYPLFPAHTMPVFAVDRWIPFRPSALWLYLSLWLYVEIPVGLLERRAELLSYGKALAAIALVGFAIFLFWPTTIAGTDTSWLQHPAYRALKEIDASGNACPSLHVAFAVFSAISIERSLRPVRAPIYYHALNVLWCLGIVYSTIATRQHVVTDVLAGALLALGVAAVYWRGGRRPRLRADE